MSTEQNNTGASQPSSEVEQLRARVEYLEERLVKAGEAGAALAAYVERLRERLGMCRHHACYSIGDSDALAMQMATIRKIASEALREDPETSLARLRWEIGARALEAAAADSIDTSTQLWLKARARHYWRRQAEEPRS